MPDRGVRGGLRDSQVNDSINVPPAPGYYKYLLAYILLSLISTLFAIDKLHSLKDNKEFFAYLLIPIILLIIKSKKRFRKLQSGDGRK